jgi:hypothetical protein
MTTISWYGGSEPPFLKVWPKRHNPSVGLAGRLALPSATDEAFCRVYGSKSQADGSRSSVTERVVIIAS